MRRYGIFATPRTLIRDIRVALKIPYVYDSIIKLCRQHAEVVQNHESENNRNIGPSETGHRKYVRLKLGGETHDSISD